MNDAKIWIWIGSILSSMSATWGAMIYRTKRNCKRLDDHDKKINKIENATITISTIIDERIPKDLPERLGRIEQHLEQINNK